MMWHAKATYKCMLLNDVCLADVYGIIVDVSGF
jgi:hypothetical protein